jgi:hypothetical protein
MGTVQFSTTFSGGDGDIFITCADIGQTLHFTQDQPGSQSLDLDFGHQIISVKGAAPSGTGGNIALAITGDIPAEIDQNFASGFIPPHSIMLFVTQ